MSKMTAADAKQVFAQQPDESSVSQPSLEDAIRYLLCGDRRPLDAGDMSWLRDILNYNSHKVQFRGEAKKKGRLFSHVSGDSSRYFRDLLRVQPVKYNYKAQPWHSASVQRTLNELLSQEAADEMLPIQALPDYDEISSLNAACSLDQLLADSGLESHRE